MAKIAVILVLPVEYNTSSMLRCKGIIQGIVDLGHQVKCYCPYPDENSKYYSQNAEAIKGVELYRFGKRIPLLDGTKNIGKKKNIKHQVKNGLLNMFRKVDVFGSTLLYIPERKAISDDISNGKFDLLISFSDPMPAHMIAKYCKAHNPQLKYIQQWGDPLASDTISKTALPVWIRKRIENALINPANKICYVSPFTCEEQKKLFPKQAEKMIFLPTPSLEYKDEFFSSERMCFGYFGSYNSIARNILPFYQAAKDNKGADFIIIGDSDIQLQETENIKILNRVSQQEIQMYMQKINVIVCLMNRKGNQIPGKVYHDASSTKDILFIKDGEYGNEIQEFFQKFNHYTFTDNTVEAIDSTIKHYLDEGIPVRKPVREFQAINIARELISI